MVLAPSGEPLDIAIEPQYLVAINVTMENGFALENSTVWLRNEAGDDFYPLATDENGEFAEYIPSGEWFVEVSDFTTDSNVTEIFRDVLVLDSAVTDIAWRRPRRQ